MDAPDNANISLNGSVPVVRCCRLSGLLVQPVVSEAAGPYGDPRIGSKSWKRAQRPSSAIWVFRLFARALVRPGVQFHVPQPRKPSGSQMELRAEGRLPGSSGRSRRPPRCPAGFTARHHNVLLLLFEARTRAHLEGAPQTRLESRRRRHRPALPVRVDVGSPCRRLSIGHYALDPVVMNNPPPPIRLKSNPATPGKPCRWARKDRCCTSGKC